MKQQGIISKVTSSKDVKPAKKKAVSKQACKSKKGPIPPPIKKARKQPVSAKVKITEKKSGGRGSSKKNNHKGHQLKSQDVEMKGEDDDVDDEAIEADSMSESDFVDSESDFAGDDDDDVSSEAETDVDDDDDDDDDNTEGDEEEEVGEEVTEDEGAKDAKDQGKKRKKPELKKSGKAKSAYAEPEIINKIDMIDLPRKKQMRVFDMDEWTIAKDIKIEDIDLDKWLEGQSARDSYFFGKDEVRKNLCLIRSNFANSNEAEFFFLQYIYPNLSTMRKFIEAMKERNVTPESVSLPFIPMSRVISQNPKITIGISGVRHIQRAGGLAVWPVFFFTKEQVNKPHFFKNQQLLCLLMRLIFLSPPRSAHYSTLFFSVQRQQQESQHQNIACEFSPAQVGYHNGRID